MQSRNIMVNQNRDGDGDGSGSGDENFIYFIDFQGARSGPLQYDLASLLIDPYVDLKEYIKDELLQYTTEKLKLNTQERLNFISCYQFCCLTRNMQFLGAFSFLSLKKKRYKFQQYIPGAVKSFKKVISSLNATDKIKGLSKLAEHF